MAHHDHSFGGKLLALLGYGHGTSPSDGLTQVYRGISNSGLNTKVD